MPSKNGTVTEREIGLAVLRALQVEPQLQASIQTLIDKLPKYLNLTDLDYEPSATRPNESLWEQKVRNLKSHDKTEGNIIGEGYAEHIPDYGYRLTSSGSKHLKHLGY